MRQASQAIRTGIDFLTSTQAADGSFSTQLSTQKYPFRANRETVTIFAPALTLQALSSVEGAYDIREKLANWLLQQQSTNGAFNYWPASVVQRQTRPYPDDLDDTACVFSGLFLHNSSLVDPAQLANLVRLLVAVEAEVGGPYKTWLVGKDAPAVWQDVDLAVNSNIAFLLQLVAEPLPKLQALMTCAIEAGDFASQYYPVPLVPIYFMARADRFEQGIRAQLARQVSKQLSGGFWKTPGQAALARTTLHRLGFAAQQPALQNYLLSQQLPDGSWPAETVWLDEVRATGEVYAGSPALTTALVLEALTCLQSKPSVSPTEQYDTFAPVFREVISIARSRLTKVDDFLCTAAQAALDELLQGDTGQEVVLLPQLFAASLANPPQVSDGFLTTLSLANIFGWMAYTMYDDFLDGEGKPLQLPVANIAMRFSLQYFAEALPGDTAFQQLVRTTFDGIDAANAWETANCRFDYNEHTITIAALPSYPSAEYLAERSLGHSLTPLAVLSTAGTPLQDDKANLFIKGFRHYLAARQLNDDLHDWQQDCHKGQISYVVARLLRDAKTKPGKHSKAVLLPQLEHQFWYHSLQKICEETTRQLQLGRQAFLASGLFKAENIFSGLISRLEQSMARTVDEQKSALTFLEAYTKKQPQIGLRNYYLGANDGD